MYVSNSKIGCKEENFLPPIEYEGRCLEGFTFDFPYFLLNCFLVFKHDVQEVVEWFQV